jgi:hypothetical protein
MTHVDVQLRFHARSQPNIGHNKKFGIKGWVREGKLMMTCNKTNQRLDLPSSSYQPISKSFGHCFRFGIDVEFLVDFFDMATHSVYGNKHLCRYRFIGISLN